jgi:vancomycin permeability regulator SanA
VSPAASAARRVTRLRRAARGAALLLAALAVAVGAAYFRVRAAARDRLFTRTEEVPAREVAIVFGAGLTSQVLYDRVATGADLWRARKVKRLLMSGDNRVRSHDEPNAMKRIAVDLGVPPGAIVLDYAGRRTYDSCARAREVFQIDDAVLVTQRYHLARAIYLCRHLGLPGVVGLAADRQAYGGRLRFGARELGATLKAWVDVNVWAPRWIKGPPEPINVDSDDDDD